MTGMRRRARAHPIIKKPLANRISRVGVLGVVGIFVAANLTWVVLATLILKLDGNREAFGHIATSVWVTLAGQRDPFSDESKPLLETLIWHVTLLLGLLLPTFLLGAFVFLLFRANPIVWRQKLSLERDPRRGPLLSFRFYNGSDSDLVKLQISVYARVLSPKPPYTRTLTSMPLSRHGEQSTTTVSWPHAIPGGVFTVRVMLPGDLDVEGAWASRTLRIPARKDPVDFRRLSFLVVSEGMVKDTGASFFSQQEYMAHEAIDIGHFAEIDQSWDEPPQSWTGWDQFDENCVLYVFGYGSLLSPESISRTLERSVQPERFSSARLDGWRLAWNSGADKESHPERKWTLPEGSEFEGVTVSLGLQEAPSQHCPGAVIAVSRYDLTKLDLREVNYERVDVTESTTWSGKPSNAKVYTYVPSGASTLRAEVEDGRQRVIRLRYFQLVEQAFSRLSLDADFDRTARVTPYPIVDLRRTVATAQQTVDG